MTSLFDPLKLGNLTLPNRVIMAPLTRQRSKQPGNIPWALNVEYYKQRASAGLIISEATQISQQGQGYPGAPGIHSAEQVAGVAESEGILAQAAPSVAAAVRTLAKQDGPARILICGSLYLAGEVLKQDGSLPS